MVGSKVVAGVCLLIGSGVPAGPAAEAPPFTCGGATPAHRNFEALWRFFDQNYALFDLRLPDQSWRDLGNEACATINRAVAARGQLPPGELFELMIDTVEHLNDGHVQIEAPGIGQEDDGWVDGYSFYDELYDLESNAELHYIDGSHLRSAGPGISWGTIGDIGYLSITSMEALDPEAATQNDEAVDVVAAEVAMAQAMADIGTASGIVVDVRANEGGWDAVSLAIAEWFAGSPTLAWTEQRRDGPGWLDFGATEKTYVGDARPGAYDGPVVVLTSGGTFSAAEVFVLAMRVRGHVTVIGERTSGHLSDQLTSTLPNGWTVHLSHERYRAADGMIYEATGVPVDTEVVLDVAALRNGHDVMLEEALRQS